MAFNPAEHRGSVLIGGGDVARELRRRGWSAQTPLPRANLDRPELVRDSLEALAVDGAEIVVTNTVAANAAYLEWIGHSADRGDVTAMNREGARIARAVAEGRSAAPMHVFGMIGPPGGLLSMEEISPEKIREVYSDVASGLQAGGADALLLTAFVELDTLLLAVQAAKAATDRPVLAGLRVGHGGDHNESTMGATLEQACKGLAELGVAGLVVDAGDCPEVTDTLLSRARAAADLPLCAILRPGHADLLEGVIQYSDTPVEFGARLAPLARADAGMVLADVGATAEHVAAVIAARRRLRPPLARREMM